jgi:RNA polymerase sigma-70 factor (ECF subfamily)
MTIDEYTKEAQRLSPLLKKTAMGFLHSEKDADDIVQDALLRLWQMHNTLHLPIESLAIVIVRNLCISNLRKQKKQYVHLNDKIADTNENNATAERIERVMGIIDNLPDIQQTLLRLRHMDGMDSKSIAQMTGSSDTAVRKALSRARIAVREQYMKRYNSTKIHNSDDE